MMVTKKQAQRSLAEQVSEMGDSTLECRDIMHAWAIDVPYRRVEVEGGARGALYVERVRVCMRCDTKRVELFRVFKYRLELMRSHYEYPKGYLLHGVGSVREVRGRIRREQVHRLFAQIDEESDNLSLDEE